MIFRNPRKVVCDIDDVGWDLAGLVAAGVGIPLEMLDEFYTLRNERLTMEERLAINACYADPDYFRDMQFYEGFEKIVNLQHYGAILQINTISMSEAVREVKEPQVRAKLSSLSQSQFEFGLADENTTTTAKKIDPDTYILIDDSPYTVSRATARYNIMPRRPYNQTQKARDMLIDKRVFFTEAGNMEEIFQIAKCLLEPPRHNYALSRY